MTEDMSSEDLPEFEDQEAQIAHPVPGDGRQLIQVLFSRWEPARFECRSNRLSVETHAVQGLCNGVMQFACEAVSLASSGQQLRLRIKAVIFKDERNLIAKSLHQLAYLRCEVSLLGGVRAQHTD